MPRAALFLLERGSILSLLLLGLVLSATATVVGVLCVGYVRMRRRQLADAQAYARLRALKALSKPKEADRESGSERLHAMSR